MKTVRIWRRWVPSSRAIRTRITTRTSVCSAESDYAVRDREGSAPSVSIAVQSLDKLPSAIDTLITAIRNGELDQQLAQASSRIAPKSKQAA